MRIKTSIIVGAVVFSMAVSLPVSSQTLLSAIQHAIDFNPDVQSEVSRHFGEAQTIRQAEAGYYPSLDFAAGVGVEYSRNPTQQGLFGVRANTLKRSESSLTATQNLFNGLATKNEVERTRAKSAASAYQIETAAHNVALDVTREYINVLREERILQISKENVDAVEALTKLIKERTDAGISRGVDTVQAMGRLDLARSNYQAQLGILEDAKTAFARKVGEDPRNLTLPAVPSERDLPKSIKDAMQTAMKNYPTLKEAFADIEETRAQHRTAKSTNLPKVDLVLSSSRNNNLDGVTGINNDDLAMVRMRYNLFNGGADIARQRETAYQIQQATEIKNRAILQLEEQLRYSWIAYQTAIARLPLLRSHRDSTKETLVAFKEQFVVGQRSFLDVLDENNEYFNSSMSYETQRFNLLLARYRILHSEGLLLQYVGAKLPDVSKYIPKVSNT